MNLKSVSSHHDPKLKPYLLLSFVDFTFIDSSEAEYYYLKALDYMFQVFSFEGCLA